LNRFFVSYNPIMDRLAILGLTLLEREREDFRYLINSLERKERFRKECYESIMEGRCASDYVPDTECAEKLVMFRAALRLAEDGIARAKIRRNCEA
jgi:hypothetical protein